MSIYGSVGMTALAPMRVFVVDDDRDTTECMRLLIKQWGHEVHVANQAVTAIEQAPFVKPHVMLVDLAMPIVDGLTVARKVREVPDLASMSLVALTGYADPQHRQQALDAGFDEFLIKPLPIDQLQALLDRVRARVAKSQARTALSVEAAAASQDLKSKSLQTLDEPSETTLRDTLALGDTSVMIRVQKSGISDIVILDDRGVADRLRSWLRDRGCRVGPVFEPAAGQVAFYVYSRRQARSLLAAHPKLQIESS
jgi:CheY-like chemotaxis protein